MAGSIFSRKCASDFWRGWKRLGRGARGRKRAPAVVTFNGQELEGAVDASFRMKVEKYEAGLLGGGKWKEAGILEASIDTEDKVR